MFAQVLLPVPIKGSFSYLIPDEITLKLGDRVIVPFGKKYYTAIVTGFCSTLPQGVVAKEIAEKLDGEPIIRHPQLKFWQWIADYYLCTPGEVYKAAMPAGLKIESETFIVFNPDYEESPENRLAQNERKLLDALIPVTKAITIKQLIKKADLNLANPQNLISSLMMKGAIMISEKLVERYTSRKETYLALGDLEMQCAFDSLKRSPQQEKAFLAFLELSNYGEKKILRDAVIQKSGVTPNIIKALIDKGVIQSEKKEVNRFSFSGTTISPLPTLTPKQAQAFHDINSAWLKQQVCLLHGVTSSGKTEIYLHLADYVLKQNRQVLYLVPEIALTTQLTGRLQKVFGEKVVVYHSRLTDNQRVDLYRKILTSKEPMIVIGARSAVFLPFRSLGLVVVDEEHDPSYKQQDPAPRYNARDAAIVLANMHGAKVLLGSATPAIESFHKAQMGKYGLVTLNERFASVPLPEIRLINMLEEHKKKKFSGALSPTLISLVRENLAAGRQAILYLNRRGYAPMAICKQCGYIPKCENCDVSLTYHQNINKLVCHYCGTPYQLPAICPACQEPGLEVVGYGTERIEEEIKATFPDVKIARLDLDTTRNKESYENIITAFSQGKSQILIGTQMVTKGLDFAGVGIVGVINADASINYPDFRSVERAFSTLAQVAGRAGRRSGNGIVAIQTRQPDHEIFPKLIAHDYQGYFSHEMEARKQFYYPPYARIIYIVIKHKDRNKLSAVSFEMYRQLEALLGTRVSKPQEPVVARVQSQYIRRIMLKIENEISLSRVKELLEDVRIRMTNDHQLSGITLFYDVDPY